MKNGYGTRQTIRQQRVTLCACLFALFAAVTVVAFPTMAFAEVTLSTSVERLSAPAGAAGPAATSVPLSEVLPGDVLRYTIVFENTSTQDVAAGSVVITNPLPAETLYLEGSATGADTSITFSVDGETFARPEALIVGEGADARAAEAADYRAIRWTYQPMLRAGESSQVSFELQIP